MTIKKPLVTEKASRLVQAEQYTFYVDSDTNKTQIKQEIEKRFGVKVEAVNTLKLKPKVRRRGRIVGLTKSKKKAIVTLAKGQNIDKIKSLF